MTKIRQFKLRDVFLAAFSFSILALLAPKISEAATLYASPASGSYSAGQTITVTIRTNTQGAAVNTAEANIVYSADTLELVRVSQGTTFYLPAPGSPGRGNGTAYLGGGLPTPGYNGSSGHLGTLTFRAKAAGTATVTIAAGKILLNDGFGTDSLSGKSGASFTISQAAASSSIGPVTVTSTTHPDSAQSYDKTTVELSWSRPANAHGFSFEFNQDPETIPDNVLDTTVTTAKTYENLADGVWYFHIKARGPQPGSAFGPTTHFKINIDTIPNASAETAPQKQKPAQLSAWQSLLGTLNKTLALPVYVILMFNLVFLLFLALLLALLFRRRKDREFDPDIKRVQIENDESHENLKKEISAKLLTISGTTSEEIFEKETEVAKQLRSGIVKARKKIDKDMDKIKKKSAKKSAAIT